MESNESPPLPPLPDFSNPASPPYNPDSQCTQIASDPSPQGETAPYRTTMLEKFGLDSLIGQWDSSISTAWENFESAAKKFSSNKLYFDFF